MTLIFPAVHFAMNASAITEVAKNAMDGIFALAIALKIVVNLFVVEVWHVGLLPDNKYNFQLVLRENAAYSLRQRF